ncbi:hypothetical protein L7F22_008048 [Adiantum nelumboides]|nr:hypothetical protein [Adiantum nelumboides]
MDKGEQLHAYSDRHGSDEGIGVVNSLIDMHAMCRVFVKTPKVVDELLEKVVVSWNTLLSVYSEHGQGEKLFKSFEQIQCEGGSLTTKTCLCSFKTCGIPGFIQVCLILCAKKRCSLTEDLSSKDSLVNVYANGVFFPELQQVFGKLPVRSFVTWSVLIYRHCCSTDFELVK